MATRVIEFEVAGEREIAAAWRDFQRADHTRTAKGLELGRVLHEYRVKWGSNGGFGSKGRGLTAYLRVLKIPRGTSDYWILQYEYKKGLRQRPGIPMTCECGEQFPSRTQYKRHRRNEHPDVYASNFRTHTSESESEPKYKHKNRAIEQLALLKKCFPGALIQRVGKEQMHFEVWIKVSASKVQGRGTVNVVMTYDQLKRVKGNVQVGARGSFTQAKRFLKLNT